MEAIRGAITIDINHEEDIKKASIKLFDEICNKNNLNKDNIVSIVFSCTDDITAAYPGKFIREEFSLNKQAIMHFNEMRVISELYLPLCIRIMILYNGEINELKHIYLEKASSLRRDLSDS